MQLDFGAMKQRECVKQNGGIDDNRIDHRLAGQQFAKSVVVWNDPSLIWRKIGCNQQCKNKWQEENKKPPPMLNAKEEKYGSGHREVDVNVACQPKRPHKEHVGKQDKCAEYHCGSELAKPVQARDRKDVEIINRNAERLNREAMDTLEYQQLP
jgi:hypothetical protein